MTPRPPIYAADVFFPVLLRDVYRGLVAQGYTHIGAIKGLRMLGVSLADAVHAAQDANV